MKLKLKILHILKLNNKNPYERIRKKKIINIYTLKNGNVPITRTSANIVLKNHCSAFFRRLNHGRVF